MVSQAFVLSFGLAWLGIRAGFAQAASFASRLGDMRAHESLSAGSLAFFRPKIKELAVICGCGLCVCALAIIRQSPLLVPAAFFFLIYGAACDFACALVPDKSWIFGGILLFCDQASAGLCDPALAPFSIAFSALLLLMGLRGLPFGDMKMIAAVSASCGIYACACALLCSLALKIALDRRESPFIPYFAAGLWMALMIETLI